MALSSAARLNAAEANAEPVAFFLVSDTHYLAERDEPSRMNARSLEVAGRLVDTLNALPGEAIPEAAGSGRVALPRGVIHGGDLIDSGDKGGSLHLQMAATEWRAYVADFGLNGTDGRLKYPVYEVHGNHDGPQGQGVAVDGIRERNKTRPGLTAVSENGLHYSWDWGPIHFANLGIVVGQVSEVEQKRRYHPHQSLDFLIEDLRENVADSGKPVILTHHIDVARYTGDCSGDDPQNLGKEWHPCDVRGFYEAIQPYNILAVLYGHTHARGVLTWDGQSTRAMEGLTLLNVDNSGHFGSDNQAFFYFEIDKGTMTVRECFTRDAWQTHDWTPTVWTRPTHP